jgi:hypothetical protein
MSDERRGPWRVAPDRPTWVVEEGAGADGGPGLVAACETAEDAALIVALRSALVGLSVAVLSLARALEELDDAVARARALLPDTPEDR